MLIRSQERTKIINMDAIKIIEMLQRENIAREYAENREHEIYANNELIGRYRTRKRAKEILDMICEAYQYNEESKYTGIGVSQPEFVFCMPEEKED